MRQAASTWRETAVNGMPDCFRLLYGPFVTLPAHDATVKPCIAAFGTPFGSMERCGSVCSWCCACMDTGWSRTTRVSPATHTQALVKYLGLLSLSTTHRTPSPRHPSAPHRLMVCFDAVLHEHLSVYIHVCVPVTLLPTPSHRHASAASSPASRPAAPLPLSFSVSPLPPDYPHT